MSHADHDDRACATAPTRCAGESAGATPVAALPASTPSSLDRSAVLRHATQYVTATYVARALCMIRSFVNARCLGPTNYGFWGSLSFLMSFGFHLHGGAQPIMARDVPGFRARGDHEQAARTIQVALSFFSLMLGAAVLLIWTIAWRQPAEAPLIVRVGWWVAGVAMPLEVLFFFEQTVARSEQRFGDLGWGVLVTTVISVALTLWLVTRYGLAGILIVALVTPLAGAWWLHRRAAYAWRFVWDWSRLRQMLIQGWPILAMSLVFEAMGWIDRSLVLGFVGLTGFGYYGLAVMLAQVCYIFPDVIALVVEPKLYAAYAQRPEAEAVREHVWFPLRTLAWVMPLGLAAIDLVLPVVIGRWLPAYAPGVPVMRVLMWGSLFMGLTTCTRSFIVARGQQGRVLWRYGVAIAVNLILGIALASRGWGLVGIAAATVAAQIVCCTQLLGVAMRELGCSARQAAGRIVALYAPAAALLVATILVPQWAARHVAAADGPLVALLRGLALAAYAAVAWSRLRPSFAGHLGAAMPAMPSGATRPAI